MKIMTSQSHSSPGSCSHVDYERLCKCGLLASFRTSWTDFNYGRRFYNCPAMKCDYFVWVDPPRRIQQRTSRQPRNQASTCFVNPVAEEEENSDHENEDAKIKKLVDGMKSRDQMLLTVVFGILVVVLITLLLVILKL
ncbi:uncharacterized protein LOC130742466 [Lotus japonicus]|uniref:uncharacterized protein LOC130742466 n=1 Tax=Lotus japonicus TaxID=34305 RepID=UPI00258A92D2|nr:uncharacterized protein LOC130742466 [Lotus japonicus]